MWKQVEMPLIDFLRDMKSELSQKIDAQSAVVNEKFAAVNEKFAAVYEKIAEARGDMIFKAPVILTAMVTIVGLSSKLPSLWLELQNWMK